MQKLNADLQGGPRVRIDNSSNRVFHELEISNIEITIENFNLLSEGGDIANLLGGFSEFITEYVKKFLMTKFNEQMLEALE